MRKGVRARDHQSMADPLGDVELQRAVVRDADRPVEIGIWIVSHIRYPQVNIAGAETNGKRTYAFRIYSRDLGAIRKGLLVRSARKRRILLGRDAGLVERQRHQFVNAVITHVA